MNIIRSLFFYEFLFFNCFLFANLDSVSQKENIRLTPRRPANVTKSVSVSQKKTIPVSKARQTPVSQPKQVPIANFKSNQANLKSIPKKVSDSKILLGIDVLEKQGFRPLYNKRVGLLSHQAGVNRNGVPSYEVLFNASKKYPFKMVSLFGPEHGFFTTESNGKFVQTNIEPKTKLPIYSLYTHETRFLNKKQLEEIDVLVVDLQDIGIRNCTYPGAMRFAIESCFNANKEVIVLDRPNPLGGKKVDGPIMERPFTTYLGPFMVPYIHGLTIGEMAKLTKIDSGNARLGFFDTKRRQNGRLTVIPMEGWKREMTWEDTGLKWIPPSTAIKTQQTLYVSSATSFGCMGGVWSHGIRSDYPFRLLTIRNKNLSKLQMDRVIKHIKTAGLDLQLKDNRILVTTKSWSKFRPMEFSLRLLEYTKQNSSKNPFASLSEKDYKSLTGHIIGSTEFIKELNNSRRALRIYYFLKHWQNECEKWKQDMKKNNIFLYF